ncbi:MAG: RdgB/HAM1 family non-canonical purine NTP pyrophosphatase [Ignavibacteriales bacterium]|nr:RdgB/HAM1 family non-canonical purine NTP pyrophosphatase [Ignavibacteriales bacterium]
MKQILLATNNLHKVEEIKSILSGLQIELLSLKELELDIEVEEDGKTLEENALKKAREIFRATNIPSLADDTGLEVFALNGEPGVFSARYSGTKATYKSNCEKLLHNLKNVSEEIRKAQFRCVIAFVDKDFETTVEGNCVGKIISEMRGKNGFGYDSVFLPDGFTETFAELSSEEKNIISHRGKALEKMKGVLKQHF